MERLKEIFNCLSSVSDCSIFTVKSTTCVDNYVAAAEKILSQSPDRVVVAFSGENEACWRTISCVESLKRKLFARGLKVFQLCKIVRTESNCSGNASLTNPPPRDGQQLHILVSLKPVEIENGSTSSSDLPTELETIAPSQMASTETNPWKRNKKSVS